MNNRIKDLAMEISPDMVYNNSYCMEEFAKLIIRECAHTAAMFSIENKRIHPDFDPRDMPSASQTVYHATCQSVAYAIKEHFGLGVSDHD